MIVGILTYCHTQYTSDRSICTFYLMERHLYTIIKYATETWSVTLLNKNIHILLSQVYFV